MENKNNQTIDNINIKKKLAIISSAIAFLAIVAGLVVAREFPRESLALSAEPFVRTSQSSYIVPLQESTYLPFRDWNVAEPILDAKAAAIYDKRSEKFLFQHNLYSLLPIASITKLAKALVVVEKIPSGAVITISQDARKADTTPDFRLGETFYAKDLLKVMLVRSSNDSAVAFQNYLKENDYDLVALMNQKAKHIGMLHTNFLDPAGLNDNGYSTAEDVVKLLQSSLANYEIRSALLMKDVSVTSINKQIAHSFNSTNKLLDTLPNIEGGKTGVTDGALETLALEIDLPQYDSSLVAVVLGTHDRFGEMRKLMEWAQEAYHWNYK